MPPPVPLHPTGERAVLPDGGVVHVRPITEEDLTYFTDVTDLLRRLGQTRVDHPEPGLAELTIDLPEIPTPDSALRAALRAAAARKVSVRA